MKPDAVEPEWRPAVAWVEKNVGGKVVRWERQARWRPAFFVDVERDGEMLPLYFRGDRGASDHGVYPLEHELSVLQVLEAHGIPVPHVYGFCEAPRGIVMQRMPGRANLATANDAAEVRSVMDDYVRILAQMHAIDVSAFEAVGLERPRTPEELAWGDTDSWEREYRKRKLRPEPLIEFALRWLRRNAPPDRSRVSLIACDSGQFLFDAGRVTTLLDLEIAYLGDPAADFAGMLCRDLSEPMGDMRLAVRKYAEYSGEDVDVAAVDYHTVRFGMNTPMCTAHIIAEPPADTDLVRYLGWYWVYARGPFEALGRLVGVELDDPLVPDAASARHEAAHGFLQELLQPRDSDDEFAAYQRDIALRTAVYLSRADSLGPALEAQDLDEAAEILGRRPESWADADAALEAFVLEAGPERDAALTRFFYRRCLRQEALLKPVLREMESAQMQRLD